MPEPILIIGASAAGLAVAAALRQAGAPFELLEATQVVGTAWRGHYDRLHLHTPKGASGLPGLPMPRAWPNYPAREQVVAYLEAYRAHHGIEPRYGCPVSSLTQEGGGWLAVAGGKELRARKVVVATGYTRRPVRPSFPGLDGFQGTVLHSSEYKNGARWKGRPVLVIGFGNSACEQAIDLVEHGALPHLSVRGAVNVIPRDFFGIPVLSLGVLMRGLPPGLADLLSAPLMALAIGDITKVGLRKLPYGPNTQIQREGRIPLLDIGTMAHLRAGRIQVHGGVERFTAGGAVFAGGREEPFDAVVLATGYRPALEEFLPQWREVCDEQGRPRVSGAATALTGLYFCGFYVSPTGMLREIGLEAQRLARLLAA
jgi:indole-3-pyruvate monooxygenase